MPCIYASRLLKYKYQRLLPQDDLKGIARLHNMAHTFTCKATRSGSGFGLLMGSERRISLQKTAPFKLLRWRFAADRVQRLTIDIAKRRVRTRGHCHTREHQIWILCCFILYVSTTKGSGFRLLMGAGKHLLTEDRSHPSLR